MDKKISYKKEFDIILLSMVVVLLIIGSIMIYSRTYSKNMIIKHILIIIFSFICGLIIYFTNILDLLKKYFIFIYIINLVLLIIPIIFKNYFSVNNSYRWIRFGVFSIQPSELAKLTIVLILSSIFGDKKSRLFDFKRDFLIPFVLILSYILIIILQKDLSTSIVFFIILVLTLYISGVPSIYLFYLLSFSFLSFVLLTINGTYRAYRLVAFLNPFKYSSDLGFQVLRSFTAIVNGSFMGKGLGYSFISNKNIPLSYSDFIFSAVCEELGLIGSFFLIISYFIIFFRGVEIIKKQTNIYYFFLAFISLSFIIIQAFLNIFVSFGLIPPTGLTLPFISYGGTSIFVFIIMLFFLLKVS